MQAEDGIFVNAGVTTTGGALHFDGDDDDSSAGANLDHIRFTDGVALKAATLLTLQSVANSNLIPAGKLTLSAGTGIVLLEDLITAASGNPMVLNSDFGANG